MALAMDEEERSLSRLVGDSFQALPPRSAETLPSAKSEEEIDREEQDMFIPGPEVYVGIGLR